MKKIEAIIRALPLIVSGLFGAIYYVLVVQNIIGIILSMVFLGAGLTFFQFAIFGKFQKKKVESRSSIILITIIYFALSWMIYAFTVYGKSTPQSYFFEALLVTCVALWVCPIYAIIYFIIQPRMKDTEKLEG